MRTILLLIAALSFLGTRAVEAQPPVHGMWIVYNTAGGNIEIKRTSNTLDDELTVTISYDQIDGEFTANVTTSTTGWSHDYTFATTCMITGHNSEIRPDKVIVKSSGPLDSFAPNVMPVAANLNGGSDRFIATDCVWGVSVSGQAGNDVIRGGKHADIIYGGTGSDCIRGGEGNDDLFGGTGSDCIYGDKGNDEISGNSSSDCLFGGEGNDDIWGDDHNDSIYGGDGNDKLYGGKGNDLLEGEGDNDELFGEDGNDYLLGGAGADHYTGGAGSDTMTDNVPGYFDTFNADDGHVDDTIYCGGSDWVRIDYHGDIEFAGYAQDDVHGKDRSQCYLAESSDDTSVYVNVSGNGPSCPSCTGCNNP